MNELIANDLDNNEVVYRTPDDKKKFINDWKKYIFSSNNFDISKGLKEKEEKIQVAMSIHFE